MRAATSVALIALLAAPAFAAPISSAPVEEEPSITTQVISSAAGGAASGAVGNLLTKIESLFRRDFDERSTGALTNIIKQAQTLSTSDKATVKTALMNKIGTLQGKRDDSELEARAPLSATGLGGSLLSSAAGGAASGLVGNLLGEVEKLFRRDDFELEARSPLSSAPVEEEPSITTQVISSAAGGAASGAVGNLLSKLESLFRRDLDERSAGALTNIVKQAQTLSASDKATVKTALMNKISTLKNKRELEARAPLSATGLGGSIISSAAGGAASGLVGNLLGEVEKLFRRDLDERSAGALTNIVKQAQTLSASDKATVKTALMNKISTLKNKRDDNELEARAPLSATGLGGSIISSAAGGAASGLVGNLLGEVEKLFRRDDFELEARAPLSATGLGGSIISSAAGGAASGLVGNLLGEVEKLFRRDDAELEARAGLGGAIASSVAGGAASGLVGNLLGEIESFFKRDEFELEARAPLSSSSLGGSLLSSAAGGAASGLVGNLLGEVEKLFRRGVTDVHDEELYVKRDVSSISTIIKQAQTLSASDKATVKNALMTKIGTLQTPSKRLSGSGAVGTALGGLASVGANSVVSGLLSSIESLFKRDEFELEARAPLSATGLGGSLLSSAAGGAASGLVGNLLSEVESLFRRSDEFEINDLD